MGLIKLEQDLGLRIDRSKLALPLLLLLADCTSTEVDQTIYPPDPASIATQTCRQWVSEHVARTPQAEAQTEWLLDVFRTNGLKIEENGDWWAGRYSKRVLEFGADMTCKEHPTWALKELADVFVKGAKQRLFESVAS